MRSESFDSVLQTNYPASTARQILRQYRYVQKKTFWAYLRKIKIFINFLDQNFMLILLMSFLLAFSKIKVLESSVEIWER